MVTQRIKFIVQYIPKTESVHIVTRRKIETLYQLFSVLVTCRKLDHQHNSTSCTVHGKVNR